MKRAIVVFIVATILACAPAYKGNYERNYEISPPITNKSIYYEMVKDKNSRPPEAVEYDDEFLNTKRITVEDDQIGLVDYSITYMWLCAKKKTSAYVIQIAFNLDDWYFLDSCFAKGGKNLKCKSVDRVVHTGRVTEQLTFDINSKFLRSIKEPYPISFYGKRGTADIVIKPEHVNALLAKVESLEKIGKCAR